MQSKKDMSNRSFEKKYIFIVAATEKKSPEALIFELPQNKGGIIVADTEVAYNPGGFVSAG